MQEQLFLNNVDFVPTRIPSRPNCKDPIIIRQVAGAICEQLGYAVPALDADLEQYKNVDTFGEFEDILEVLDDTYDWDGFQLGKALEDHKYWDVSFEIVDALSNAESIRYGFYDTKVQAWVRDYKLTPKYAKDAVVLVNYSRQKKQKQGPGVIVSVDEKRLKYTIFIEELGHGKYDPEYPSLKVIGNVVNEEDILGLVGETTDLSAL
jgi:hypothetical protein